VQNHSNGIVVAATHHLEWLLPWWWYNYQAHNTLPVAFFDLGLSPKYKAWAEQRGLLIPLEVPDSLVFPKEQVDPSLASKWEEVIGSGVWDVRLKWFKKPFAFASAPFSKNLWIDLDCEVRTNVSPFFPLLTDDIDLAIVPEPEALQNGLRSLGLAEEKVYNSGVVLYHKDAPFLFLWLEEVLKKNHLHIGDQEALSRVLANNPISLKELTSIYNWDRGLGPNPDALIFHWHGQKGKQLIKEQIEALTLMGLFESP
jgi:hypothetical protein